MTVASALSLLSDETLEDLWHTYNTTDRFELADDVFAVLLTREDFCPQAYDLLWELQDAGWNGGCTQEDRDAR